MSVDLKSLCEEWLGPVELKKLLTRILGTLTAENYDDLSKELLGSTFPSMVTVCSQHPEALDDAVDVLFSAVANEKIGAIFCARLCEDIAMHWYVKQSLWVPPKWESPYPGGGPSFDSQFKRQISDRCLTELQAVLKTAMDGIHSSLDGLPRAEKEPQEGTLANMRFIGELYNQDVIAEETVLPVMLELLFPNSPHGGDDDLDDFLTDEGLEVFCELMVTVGKQLDGRRNPIGGRWVLQHIMNLFQKVTWLSSSFRTPRVRVKLQSILDLRRNKWVRVPMAPALVPLV